MKTAIATVSWIGDPKYFARTVRWVAHNRKVGLEWDIVLLDNGSPQDAIARFLHVTDGMNVRVVPFVNFYKRESLTHYAYEWRALYALKPLFQLWEYDRVVLMANDFFVLSDRMKRWIDQRVDGWSTPFCPLFDFPESGLQVVTRGCNAYELFVATPDWKRRNGLHYEHTLPLTFVDRELVGDRYSEGAVMPATPDFIAQLRLEDAVPECSSGMISG